MATNFRFLFPVLLVFVPDVSLTADEKSRDRVYYLPGLERQPTSKHYSGYLSASGGRKHHYWLVESQGSPAKDPLVLWLNGGPGCSSMTGLLEENGPFWTTPDGKTLKENEYSWNKIANMLYMESPAGVGFSYTEEGDYTPGDDQTSHDNFLALKDFFRKFPEYKSRDFYITGESYAGIYVPMLAGLVVDDPDIAFKGFCVGNGVFHNDMGIDSLVYYVFYHGLLGRKDWNQLTKSCCKGISPTAQRCAFNQQAKSNTTCALLVAKTQLLAWNIGLNPYNLYAPCDGGVPTLPPGTLRQEGDTHRYDVPTPLCKLAQGIREKLQELKNKEPNVEVQAGTPCTNSSATTQYLNQPHVRKAINIPDSVPNWQGCSAIVSLTYDKQYGDMTPLFRKVLDKGHRISVYNGDSDMACNFLSNEWFVDSLEQKLLIPYKPWFYYNEKNEQQIAGFVKQFHNVNFLTVRGSGHFVPKDKPLQAFILFENFIKDEPF